MKQLGLGERDIIRLLTKRFPLSRQKLPLGFDDDISAVPISRRNWLILKTDTLVASTDIPPGMSLEQATRKAVVATVSDFAAKGVQPRGLLISLGLEPPVTRLMVQAISKGIQTAAREYGCPVVGGDTGESSDLFVSCVGFGFAEPGMILRRDGARAGDIIAVTGHFGRTSAGLRILLSKNKSLARRFPGLVRSILHPVARLDTGVGLAKTGSVHSSIDSSDGLAWSLHEIARLSRVKMALDQIPIAVDAERYAKERRLDSKKLALYGGEEYELVQTIQKESFAKLRRKVPSLIRIGSVELGRGEVVLRSQGREHVLNPQGWEHLIPTRSNEPHN